MSRFLLPTAAAALALAAVFGGAGPAQSAGCLKGAAVGGVAGRMAGHGVLGAAAGCAVGRHEANQAARALLTESGNDTGGPA